MMLLGIGGNRALGKGGKWNGYRIFIDFGDALKFSIVVFMVDY